MASLLLFTAGAVGAGAGQAMLSVMTPEFFNILGITDANAINTIKNLGVTLAGAAAGSAAGAASAFNADANNRQIHHQDYKIMKSSCGISGGSKSSLDCERLLSMEGVSASPRVSLQGVPGTDIVTNFDAAGNIVGALLVDAKTGLPYLIVDRMDYDKIMAIEPAKRNGALISNMAISPLRGMSCNEISLTCETNGGALRSELDNLYQLGKGKYTVFYNGADIDLKGFIFRDPQYPNVGDAPKDMVVDWIAMAKKYGFRLWADDTMDVTKFGSIRVQRVDANTVQILPDDYDFDIKNQQGSLMRDAITNIQDLRAKSWFGMGSGFTIVVRGTTKIGP